MYICRYVDIIKLNACIYVAMHICINVYVNT